MEKVPVTFELDRSIADAYSRLSDDQKRALGETVETTLQICTAHVSGYL